MTPAGGMPQAVRLTEYLDELRKVKASTMTTCHELVHDLDRDGLAVEALRADEASAFIRASFTSLERLLVARIAQEKDR